MILRMPNATASDLSIKVDPGRLRRRRIEAGMTVTMLGNAAGCAQSTISGIETGRRQPSPPLLKRIADALKLTVADLLLAETAGVER